MTDERHRVARESPKRGGPDEDTLRTYGRNFRRFAEACAEAGVESLPVGPADALRILSRIFEEGAAEKTVLGLVSAVNFAHRQAGFEPPCQSSAAVKAELRRRFPAEFEAQSREDSHSWRDEREGTQKLLETLGQQAPALAPLCGILVRLLNGGRHLEGNPQVLFAHLRVGEELLTKCRVCGEVVSVGRLAKPEEAAEHACNVVFRLCDDEESA